MSRWISVWPRGGVTPWWATSHPSYCHTCMLCVCASACTAQETSRRSLCANVCVYVRSVRQMVKYESRLGGTTPAGTPWVCLPPPILNLPPRLLCLPCFPSSFISAGCMYACVCVCVLGWRGWAPCDTWQRWARIRDVPAGEVVWCRGGGGEGYCIYCLSSWDLIKLTLHRPSAASHTHTQTQTHTYARMTKTHTLSHTLRQSTPGEEGFLFCPLIMNPYMIQEVTDSIKMLYCDQTVQEAANTHAQCWPFFF